MKLNTSLGFSLGGLFFWLGVGLCGTESTGSFIESLNCPAINRPATVSDALNVKVVDYIFDGMPSEKVEMVHPSMVVTNAVLSNWNLRPGGSGRYSASFVNRTFQNSQVSITLFAEGVFVNKVDSNTMLGVAAGLLGKHGASIAFAPWQDSSFQDPDSPRGLRSFQPLSIGYSLSSSDGSSRVFRLYYFQIGSWTIEVEYQGLASEYESTFPMFVDYTRSLVFNEGASSGARE